MFDHTFQRHVKYAEMLQTSYLKSSPGSIAAKYIKQLQVKSTESKLRRDKSKMYRLLRKSL